MNATAKLDIKSFICFIIDTNKTYFISFEKAMFNIQVNILET